jgi:hypothetical protein
MSAGVAPVTMQDGCTDDTVLALLRLLAERR